MATATVRIKGGLIDGQDGLTEVQNAILRNKPKENTMSIGDLTGQLLRIVKQNLKRSHVFEASFPNGDKILFIGRLPQFVSEETIMNTVLKSV